MIATLRLPANLAGAFEATLQYGRDLMRHVPLEEPTPASTRETLVTACRALQSVAGTYPYVVVEAEEDEVRRLAEMVAVGPMDSVEASGVVAHWLDARILIRHWPELAFGPFYHRGFCVGSEEWIRRVHHRRGANPAWMTVYRCGVCDVHCVVAVDANHRSYALFVDGESELETAESRIRETLTHIMHERLPRDRFIEIAHENSDQQQ